MINVMNQPECRNCAYWSYDMDMEPFCVHPNANAWGTDINAMRRLVKTPNMRGEPCGPEGKFFESRSRSKLVP